MTRRRRALRLTAACAILAAGLWGLVGCLYIPHFGKDRIYTFNNQGGLSPEYLVGSAKQGRPLVLGQSTAEDVARILKWPKLEWSTDGRFAVCHYTVVDGYFVFPLCLFETYPTSATRYLRLTFDHDGRLRSADTYDDYPAAIRGTTFENQVPRQQGLR